MFSTFDELVAFFGVQGNCGKKFLRSAFDRVDSNGDGRVDFSEFLKMSMSNSTRRLPYVKIGQGVDAAPSNSLCLYEDTDYNTRGIDVNKILVIPNGERCDDFGVPGFSNLASSVVNNTGMAQTLHAGTHQSGQGYAVQVGARHPELRDFNDKAESIAPPATALASKDGRLDNFERLCRIFESLEMAMPEPASGEVRRGQGSGVTAAPEGALTLYEDTDFNGRNSGKYILIIPNGASADDFNYHGFANLASSAVNRTGSTQRLYNQPHLSGTYIDIAVGELARLQDFNDRAESAAPVPGGC
ncbi:hypothetical protein ACFXPT_29225 [Streptomyces goshikiensis]|uniref:hypothetical protein n=1 Tax=Streptomyces goshikiensis TaxID=1942 RepID=UPI0036928480